MSRIQLDPLSLVTAPWLLNAVLWRGAVALRLTEVEAYTGADDPASHAWKGPTRRSAVMFGPPGRLYTYTMHGHVCANIICTPEGVGGGILMRAGKVIEGLGEARERRGQVPDVRLARGPGNLAKALGITMADAGADILDPDGLFRLKPRRAEPSISTGPRVGVSQAADVPWRFWVTGDPTVSAYRPSQLTRERRVGTREAPRPGPVHRTG